MTMPPGKRPKANTRQTAAPEQIVDAAYGPAMTVLNERQRLFVAALFQSPKKHGAAAFAARAAGYGSSTSSAQSIASIASRLCSDPKIQDAIHEESRKYITALGPTAVRALKDLLGRAGHKDHGRAVGILMDRIAPLESTHTVRVTHDATPALVASAAVLARINQLALRAGIDPAKMPPLIDARPNGK